MGGGLSQSRPALDRWRPALLIAPLGGRSLEVVTETEVRPYTPSERSDRRRRSSSDSRRDGHWGPSGRDRPARATFAATRPRDQAGDSLGGERQRELLEESEAHRNDESTRTDGE